MQPTATRQTESTVLQVPVEKVWESFKNLAFDKLFPSVVAKVTYTSGQPGLLESTVKVEYQDKHVWEVRICEISDLNFSIVYEVIAAEPATHTTSIVNRFRLHRITDTNETLLVWSTQYSSDVTANTVQDSKFKKLDGFKELKTIFKQK